MCVWVWMGVEYSFDCMFRVDGFGMLKFNVIDVVGSCKFVEQVRVDVHGFIVVSTFKFMHELRAEGTSGQPGAASGCPRQPGAASSQQPAAGGSQQPGAASSQQPGAASGRGVRRRRTSTCRDESKTCPNVSAHEIDAGWSETETAKGPTVSGTSIP